MRHGFWKTFGERVVKQSRHVLWTANIVLPEVAPELGLKPSPFGGWLSLMTRQLAGNPEFRIGVAMRADVSALRQIDKGGISYFAVPMKKRDRFDISQVDCEAVLARFKPDILHVEGAEMRHARRFLSTWDGPSLVSLQGVLHGYAAYELGRLPILNMLAPWRPRMALTAMALIYNRLARFSPRLRHEARTMRLATHVTGRTLWDRSQAAVLAPQADYYHCSRILRDPFYQGTWMRGEREEHAVFVGNGASPRKGLHVALQAIALLKKDFPGIRLYVAGENPADLPLTSIKRHVGYPVYINYLIDKLGLRQHVCFTGVLDAGRMQHRMRTAHAYLMSSIIENSPNTLGEAMLMGVPTVSAYAGGVPSMARDETEALLYRPDDPAMLAFQLRRIFTDETLCENLSRNARARALVTHDPGRNRDALIGIYRRILERSGNGGHFS